MKWLEDVDAEELSDQFKRLSRAARERVQEEIDVEQISKQLSRLSSRARKRFDDEVNRRRRPRRRVPWGLLIAGGVGIGIGAYLVASAERRRRLQEQATSLYGQARDRVPKMAGRMRSTIDETATKAADEAAILAQLGSPPGHLDVEVEGRTVYLRGRVEEPGFVDRAVEVARGVDGVVNVINLTVEPEGAPATNAVEL
jgi:osmotically-inducible protein OsmY